MATAKKAAPKKAPAKKQVADRLDDRWDGVKLDVYDKNGKLIQKGTAHKVKK